MKHPIIECFEKAVREHAFIGTYDVQDRPLIEADYKVAKLAIEELITNAINLQVLPAVVIDHYIRCLSR